MSSDRIRELAAGAGAQAAEPLPPSEAVAFELRPDGGVDITLASGEVLRTLSSDIVPAAIEREHRATSAELLRYLCLLTPGGPIRTGVRYHRRLVRVGGGECTPIFSEAGR
jgi:hypothetical protein